MTTISLAESKKYATDMLAPGVIDTIIDVDPMIDFLPFIEVNGAAYSINRENTIGDAQYLGIGGTITAKNPATVTRVNFDLTTIIADAEVNGLLAAQINKENDLLAAQTASKSKEVGRVFGNGFVNGSGTSDEINGLLNQVDASKIFVQDTAGDETNGGPLSFEKLEETIDAVKSKGSTVDFISMSARTIRSFKSLLRGLGGAGIVETLELPTSTGNMVRLLSFNGIPIFRNDYMPLDQTTGTLTTGTSVIVGNFDDGTRSVGVAALTPAGAPGVTVEAVGPAETKDETITRIKMYTNVVSHSLQGLAVLTGVSN